ncbi:MAG: hypothetical protein ACK5LC_04380 [Coprobacillaceae bacterium]
MEEMKVKIREWILKINEEGLPEDIKALNFGLFEPYGIELIGSMSYDIENDDWACEEDYVPKERTCPSLSIPTSYTWNEVLIMMIKILKELVQELDIPLFHVTYITTDFSDGDLEIIKEEDK